MEKETKDLILQEVENILAREAKREASAMRYQRPFDASTRQSAMIIKKILD